MLTNEGKQQSADELLAVRRVVAVGGEGAGTPRHYRTRRAVSASYLDPDASPAENRFISGGPLTGIRVSSECGLGLYDNKFSILPDHLEEHELIGG